MLTDEQSQALGWAITGNLTPAEYREFMHFLGWPEERPRGAEAVRAVVDQIVAQQIVAQMQDVAARGREAQKRLDEMTPTYWEKEERARLHGKAQGVGLVVSYIDEAIRLHAPHELQSEPL